MQKLKCQFMITNNTLLFKIDEQEGFPKDFEFKYNDFRIRKVSALDLTCNTIYLQGTNEQRDNKITQIDFPNQSELKEYCSKLWQTLREYFDDGFYKKHYIEGHTLIDFLYVKLLNDENQWVLFNFTKDDTPKTDIKKLLGKCIKRKDSTNVYVIRAIDIATATRPTYPVMGSDWLNKDILKDYQWADSPDGEWQEFNL